MSNEAYNNAPLETVSAWKNLSILAVAGCFMLAAIAGCAYRNEGAIDYRKSEVAAGSGQSAIGRAFVESLDISHVGGGQLKVPALNLDGEDVRLVPLVRKNVSSPAPAVTFTDQDSISIRLQAAFITYYSEGPFSYVGDVITEGQYVERGEVAIVVNAFQLGEGGADFDFSDEGINKGRVVYFSQDVEEDQFLNFSNMPVYGPVTYEAKPIGIDIAVMELDLSDEVTVDLLTKLASLGGKAFPAAAPGLEILNSLGETLVQKQTNDINARYTLLFDAPEGGHPDLPRATIEVGNYIFLRLENRQDDIDWEELLLDENTGKLYLKNRDVTCPDQDKDITDDMCGDEAAGDEAAGDDAAGDDAAGDDAADDEAAGDDAADDEAADDDAAGEEDVFVVEPYRANNYFTFQVNKNEKAVLIDLPNYDFGTFLAEMNRKIAEDNQNLSKILEPIKKLVERRVQIALFDGVRSSLATLARLKVAYDGKLAAEAKAIQENEAEPEDPDLAAAVASAATSDRVRAEIDLLLKFDATWNAFKPSLVEGSAPKTGLCPDDNAMDPAAPDGDGADDATEERTKLSSKQCTYVLTKFAKIADVSDWESFKYFRSVDLDILNTDRRKEICGRLIGKDAPGIGNCG